MITALLGTIALLAAAFALACHRIGKTASLEAEAAIALARQAIRDRDRAQRMEKYWRNEAKLCYALAAFWKDMSGPPAAVRPSPASPASLEELMPGPTVEEEAGPETWGV
jgi:hypothetical protein